jgi:molecular chaperone Hsp33
VDSIIAELGAVTVTCEFCQQPYRFDAVDAERLFRELPPGAPSAAVN